MKIKWLVALGIAAMFTMTGSTNANLLTNGDFTLDNGVDVSNAADWTHYWSAGWISRETNGNGTYGDTNNFHYAIGNAGPLDNGIFQDVAGTAGLEYQLTADAALDDWWSPTGLVKIEFRDATNALISSVETLIVANGFDGAVAQPWALRSVSGVAPSGTVTVRALLGVRNDGSNVDPGTGGGTARFDNADLQVIPEPATLGLVGLFGGGLLLVRRRFRI